MLTLKNKGLERLIKVAPGRVREGDGTLVRSGKFELVLLAILSNTILK
jgi:hypothetical protein